MREKVYFIPASGEEHHEVLSRKIETLYLHLGLHDKIEKNMFVALKIHFGEKDNTGYIKPPWLSGMIKQIKTGKPVFFLQKRIRCMSEADPTLSIILNWQKGMDFL